MMDIWKKRSVQNQVGTLEVIRETIEEKVNIAMQLHIVLNVIITLLYRLRKYEGPGS
jgi:hypothetical protein